MSVMISREEIEYTMDVISEILKEYGVDLTKNQLKHVSTWSLISYKEYIGDFIM